MNTIKKIENYILENQHIESPEAWEYEHTPFLTNLINNLDQTEINDFCNKVLEWEDDELYYLITLSLYYSSNKFLDATSLYIKIFCKIQKIEYLDILVENDIAFIRPPYDTTNKIKDWDIEQIGKLKQNILRVMTVKSDSWKETLKEVVDFLDQLIINKASC